MSGSGIGGTLGTALGVALAPETGGMSLAIPALAGAAGSAAGGAFTGSKNMWRDALLGGIGGGISGGLNNAVGGADGLGALFKGAPDASEIISPELAAADPSLVNPSTSSAIWDSAKKFAPYAGLSGGALLLDKAMAPKQVGPTGSSPYNPNSPKSMPLNRQQQAVDPNSYFTTGGNRSYFDNVNPQPTYYANGGKVRRYADGGDVQSDKGIGTINPMAWPVEVYMEMMRDKSPKKNNSENLNKDNSDLVEIRPGEWGRVKRKSFANGGSSSASSSNIPPRGRKVRGGGDGRSDSIPAMLSDGEFVVSAPVVSALGNGSNDAGAKQLDGMQKKVLRKHYKGGKPSKAMGIGAYVH